MNINEAFVPFMNSKSRYNILLGGAGSGKSFSAIQKILSRILVEPGHRILCVRKVAATLRNSIYQNFVDIISSEGVSSEFTINKSEMRFTHRLGGELILHGMDDSEKIKSIAGVTSVWCEEATELEESDFNQLELRVRGETVSYKQFILTFNPIDEDHWIKKRFFDVKDSDYYIFRSTYKDNMFLDNEYIKHLTERVRIDENLHRIYVLGEWGKEKTGGEFYKQFSYSRHISVCKYNPDLPLHVSFDENVNPYFPCAICQIDGGKVMMIDEILGRNPNNTVTYLCNEIKRKYHNHVSGMFIYGDATSQKADVKIERGYDLFRLIVDGLAMFRPSRRVSKSNPSVIMRGDFINTIFQQNVEGIEVFIDENCKSAINDFLYTKEGSDGKKDKRVKKDPKSGISYQEYGHLGDCFDYMICYAFSKEYQYYQTGNKPHQFSMGQNLSRNAW